MFACTSSAFRSVLCPANDTCTLPNCIFQHEKESLNPTWVIDSGQVDFPDGGTAKRRKVETTAVTTTPSPPPTKAKPFVGRLLPSGTEKPLPLPNNKLDAPKKPVSTEFTSINQPPPKVSRNISPPPLRRTNPIAPNASSLGKVKPTPPAKQETLNPRKLQKDPAGHATRVLYLAKLHEGISRLNAEARKSADATIRALSLTDGQAITLALDEEEKIAIDSPSVYANVIKLRMVAYKKMTLEQWKDVRLAAEEESKVKASSSLKSTPASSSSSSKLDQSSITNIRQPILTGLTTTQELSILPQLLAKQAGLEQYGYVTTPPTAIQMAAAKAGVLASAGFEQCERCKSRFQVFPDRRPSDGALTTGGPCTYHHGRRERPAKSRLDTAAGQQKEMAYSCCGEAVGVSIGCVTAASHVFKVNDTKRLAALWQFEMTPENAHVDDTKQAVAFDCEMAYTVHGMELIRLTATSWPSGAELLDVLVRPLGTILDLNSRYSGVSNDMFAHAVPYSFEKTSSSELPTSSATGALLILPTPMAARRLLFTLLTPRTPLIGHAIENDLNVTRIVHPCIIDTVLLFPHQSGLPYRRSLKTLTKQLLQRDIQTSSVQGHDSKEDARATGDLVLEKVKRRWKEMVRAGWRIVEGRVTPPATNEGVKEGGVVGNGGCKRLRESE